MVNLGDMYERYSKIREEIKPEAIFNTAAEVADEEQDVLLTLNRDQMLLGRNTEGELLKPDYKDDPYFKTPEGATKYAEMKDNLLSAHNSMIINPQLYADKPVGTPNLIITGTFQNNMHISVSGRQYEIDSTYVESGDIEEKYQHKVFGLAPRSKEYFWLNYIKPRLKKKIYAV